MTELIKFIRLSKETHKDLILLKARQNCKNLDQIIEILIKNFKKNRDFS